MYHINKSRIYFMDSVRDFEGTILKIQKHKTVKVQGEMLEFLKKRNTKYATIKIPHKKACLKLVNIW